MAFVVVFVFHVRVCVRKFCPRSFRSRVWLLLSAFRLFGFLVRLFRSAFDISRLHTYNRAYTRTHTKRAGQICSAPLCNAAIYVRLCYLLLRLRTACVRFATCSFNVATSARNSAIVLSLLSCDTSAFSPVISQDTEY